MGIFSFLTETGAVIVAMATALRMLFCKFQEHCFKISFIQYFPLFSCKQYDVLTDLPFFCTLKGLSNKHKLFPFIGTLNKEI